MKVLWLGVALLLPLLSGCLDFLDDDEPDRVVEPADVGYDPQEVTVTGVTSEEISIPSDDVTLDALVYVPLTNDAPGGEAVKWPVVVLLHGWGFPKEMYTNMPQASSDASTSLPAHDMMQEYAESGLLTVAYDARGWYRSTGTSTLAGQAELRDLQNVIQFVKDNYAASEFVGVAGASYGGAQALAAWERLPEVTTVAAHQPWVDLFQGLAPGNALKLEWTAFEAVATVPGTHVTGFPPALASWGAPMLLRQDAAAVDQAHAEMDQRSLLDRAAGVDKPILLCQGLQETLFPQIHDVWQVAPGFVRAHYYTGGHGVMDQECWQKSKHWFQFFLAGQDTGVDTWAKVSSVDHDGSTAQQYSDARIHEVESHTYFLHGEQFVESANANRTFTITQQAVGNPIHEPQAVWDLVGRPNEAVPAPLRQDPTATFFSSAPMGQTETLLGAPEVVLHTNSGTPFQVVATIYHESGTSWRMLGRGATSPLTDDQLTDGTVAIEMPWMKADLQPGDRLVLKIAANDETAFFPLPANYSVDFTGASTVSIPLFEPSGSSQ